MTLTSLPDPLWSVDRIAEYFGVKPATVTRWIHEGEMDGKKINNRWRVPQSKVFEYRDKKYSEGDK